LAVISNAVLVNGPIHSLLLGYRTLLRLTIVPFGSFISIVGEVVLKVTVGDSSCDNHTRALSRISSKYSPAAKVYLTKRNIFLFAPWEGRQLSVSVEQMGLVSVG